MGTPKATSTNVVVDNLGEVLAPGLFFVTTLRSSLSPAFGCAALAYVVAAVCPALIHANCHPEVSAAEKAAATSRWVKCREGLAYIMGHPLLPGLYTLDWGMTVFTFYRELFPIFAVQLVRPPEWLSLRATVSLLTSLNFAGGVTGSLCTFGMEGNPWKGRQVMYATLVYGAFCIAFGIAPLWWLRALAVFGAGASDAVGMTVRKTVIAVGTPRELQGRTAAGHSLAANVANSLGQLYVASACTVIGAGPTMVLGGGLTWAATGLAAYYVPALLSHKTGEEPGK